MLTDKLGRPILQYFDYKTERFEPQPEIANEETVKKIETKLSEQATEKTLKSIERTLSISEQSEQSEQSVTETPILKNITLTKSGVFVHWFHDGFFYASYRRTILRSETGSSWVDYHTFPIIGDTLQGIESIVVSDTGRIVVGTHGGEIFISDEDGQFEDEPSHKSEGRFYRGWGHFKHSNIIGFSTYSKHGESGAHEAFLSVDNGRTFKKVFDNSTLDTLPPMATEAYHLHDFEYDPYSGRLYLWQGDGPNRTLYCSDDFGESWVSSFERGVANNATQTIPTPYGIAMGSDSAPGGINYLHIDRSNRINPDLAEADFEEGFWTFDGTEERYVAYRKWIDREKGIYLMPFVGEYSDNGHGLIAYSKDGYHWQLLHKTFAKGHYFGFWSVQYGNGKLVAMHNDDVDGHSVFVADVDLG